MSKLPRYIHQLRNEVFRQMHEQLYWMQVYNTELNSYHTIPVDDLKQHECGKTCWCDPTYEFEHGRWLHVSADGRESYEEGRLLQ